MDCNCATTAKIGRLIQIETEIIQPPLSTAANVCISDKFFIDCSTLFPGSSGRIEQIDLIEYVASGDSISKPNCKIFLSSYDFPAASKGNAFSCIIPNINRSEIIAFENLSDSWADIDNNSAIQNNKNINLNFNSSAGRAIYGQLVSKSDTVFASSTSLILRIIIAKD